MSRLFVTLFTIRDQFQKNMYIFDLICWKDPLETFWKQFCIFTVVTIYAQQFHMYTKLFFNMFKMFYQWSFSQTRLWIFWQKWSLITNSSNIECLVHYRFRAFAFERLLILDYFSAMWCIWFKLTSMSCV